MISTKRMLYLAHGALTSAFTGALLYFLGTNEFRAAFAMGVVAVVLVEARVRLGHRSPRGALFWWHLGFSVPFFIALIVLAFCVTPLWLALVARALFLGVLATGGALLYRGTLAAFEH